MRSLLESFGGEEFQDEESNLPAVFLNFALKDLKEDRDYKGHYIQALLYI